LMAGLPVLVSNLPEMRQVLESQSVGICLDNWTGQKIIASLQRLQAMRDGDFKDRIAQFTQTYNWQQQEITMLNAYQKHIFK